MKRRSSSRGSRISARSVAGAHVWSTSPRFGRRHMENCYFKPIRDRRRNPAGQWCRSKALRTRIPPRNDGQDARRCDDTTCARHVHRLQSNACQHGADTDGLQAPAGAPPRHCGQPLRACRPAVRKRSQRASHAAQERAVRQRRESHLRASWLPVNALTDTHTGIRLDTACVFVCGPCSAASSGGNADSGARARAAARRQPGGSTGTQLLPHHGRHETQLARFQSTVLSCSGRGLLKRAYTRECAALSGSATQRLLPPDIYQAHLSTGMMPR